MKNSDSTCNCLAIRQASRIVTTWYDAELGSTGLRSTQYSILSRLDQLGPSTLRDLAIDLVVDRSTLGHSLRPLEREGLVRLGSSREDGRAHRLELTAAGKTRLASARTAWARAQRQFESKLGAADAATLRRLMKRAVEATTMEKPPRRV